MTPQPIQYVNTARGIVFLFVEADPSLTDKQVEQSSERLMEGPGRYDAVTICGVVGRLVAMLATTAEICTAFGFCRNMARGWIVGLKIDDRLDQKAQKGTDNMSKGTLKPTGIDGRDVHGQTANRQRADVDRANGQIQSLADQMIERGAVDRSGQPMSRAAAYVRAMEIRPDLTRAAMPDQIVDVSHG